MNSKVQIKSLSHEELSEQMKVLGVANFRIDQVERWLWNQNVSSFDEMTNLSKPLRENLANEYELTRGRVQVKQVSEDGTRKYLVQFADGISVETVGIPSHDGTRLTVCFSTQAGCAMGCTFCATGKSGLARSLNSGEMVDQVSLVADDFGARVSNVVAMGQGEPFMNYDATLQALGIMNNEPGLGIGARHITISTCGIIDGIERLTREAEQYTLAVSLHSAVQSTRDTLMPGVRSQGLAALKRTLKTYGDTTKRRPSLEFALIDSVNDSQTELDALIEFC